jgi:hypothetical protein
MKENNGAYVTLYQCSGSYGRHTRNVSVLHAVSELATDIMGQRLITETP